MIVALLDVTKNRILDVVESGDRKLLLRDLTDLYAKVTGDKMVNFTNVEEARSKVVEALTTRYFPALTKGEPSKGTVTVEAMGPVARARKVFDELKGHPRKEHIEACAKLGIKRSTAAAQYQRWMTEHKKAGTWAGAGVMH